MHIVNLGVSLWISGSILRTLVDDDCYEFFGDGTPNEQLLRAYVHFKKWAREKKWQSLRFNARLEVWTEAFNAEVHRAQTDQLHACIPRIAGQGLECHLTNTALPSTPRHAL